MPSDFNSVGDLQLKKIDLPTLNERMRRISKALKDTPTENPAAPASTSTTSTVSQIVLTVPDILAVESGAAALVTTPAKFQPTKGIIILSILPIGGSVTVQLFTNGTAWGPALSASGQITMADVSAFPPIPQDALLRLDITSVPALLTGVSFPGAGLTFELR
jgi:hypothetical protein